MARKVEGLGRESRLSGAERNNDNRRFQQAMFMLFYIIVPHKIVPPTSPS